MTILAVSYDKESLNQRKEELERAGHLIVPASSLGSALQLANVHLYDVALIGFTVPDQDADAIASHARARHPDISVIYVREGQPTSTPMATVVVQPGNAELILKALEEI